MIRHIVQCDHCSTQYDLTTGNMGYALPEPVVRVEASQQVRHYCNADCMYADSHKLALKVRDEKPSLHQQLTGILNRATNAFNGLLSVKGGKSND